MASRVPTTSVAEDHLARMSPSAVVRLEAENKSLRHLIQLLNTRHSECLYFIQTMRQMNEKLKKRLNATDVTFEDINCDNILKLDKEIDSLQQQLFPSSHVKTVQTQTTGEPIERTILRWNNGKADDNSGQSSRRFRCEYFGCQQWFARKDQMEAHLRVHNSMQSAIAFEQSFDDNYSDKNSNKTINESIIFVPQMELEVIEFANHSANTGLESLSFANSASDDSNSQNRNDKSHIRCDYCGKTFSKHYIQSHRRSHTGVKPYKCSFTGCERTFTQTSSRNYHEKTYHRIDKYSLKCYFPDCQKTFQRQVDLQKHLALHNSANAPGGHIAVQLNQATLLQPMAIDGQHLVKVVKTRKLRRVPHRSGKHACPHCGKTFAHKVALRQHEVIHGPKHFVCTVGDCKYASYWKQNLSLHLRRHHNQE